LSVLEGKGGAQVGCSCINASIALTDNSPAAIIAAQDWHHVSFAAVHSHLAVITARRHASAVYDKVRCPCMSVCVCVSQFGVLSKRLDGSRCFLTHSLSSAHCVIREFGRSSQELSTLIDRRPSPVYHTERPPLFTTHGRGEQRHAVRLQQLRLVYISNSMIFAIQKRTTVKYQRMSTPQLLGSG